ncbi:chorismate mutase [Halobacillus litoralis]|uniref:chorismate mutase n=1 Tax=Halobacillus litoralis TaxID=45668 RepID=A0A845DQD4_9BACI|nr:MULTISPECIES: chorismate mutase [Halobacillus]MCA1023288.1 chorismate mutase [Halobacillus litoralis]MYL19418.1 chorismate mutase [Halobacillus litoralis]MYL28563.1 chorismate mutase [Halobacillus halophilus]MYL38006.1 chorismate mutase [Halobacillus litoralis]
MIRGIRGATTVENNEQDEIISRSLEMMHAIIKANQLEAEDIVSVYFTVTEDVTDTFPAKSLRQIDGWTYVPVMCMKEIPVPGSLKKCIRVMVTARTDKKQSEIQHVYHHQAVQLRPDLKS